MAFGFAPRRAVNGIVSALAMLQATVAILAMGRVFLQAQNGPARGQAQERSQRAQRAAPKAGDPQVESQDDDEDRSQRETLAEMRLPKAEEGARQRGMAVASFQQCAECVIPSRQNGKRERADGQRHRVEDSDKRAAQESRHQQSEK